MGLTQTLANHTGVSRGLSRDARWVSKGLSPTIKRSSKHRLGVVRNERPHAYGCGSANVR